MSSAGYKYWWEGVEPVPDPSKEQVMSDYLPWNSQPLVEWGEAFAPGDFIKLDGIRTHYIQKGAGDPLILLHGFFFDTYMWHESIDALAQGYKVFALDLWGFGYSERGDRDYGYPLYTRQLEGFMDALKIQKAHLMGQSMGAGTIMNFSRQNPQRVDKVVLVDAAGLPNPLPIMGRISNLPLVGELMYAMRGDFIRRMTLATTFVYNRELITDEFFENAMRFHKIKGTSEVMLYITRREFFDKLEPEIRELAGLHLPTLIVWGREEPSIPLSTGEELHRILRGSQFHILDRAGHCSNIDRPGEFNAVVLDFLGA
jgi:pimeloyl-ACP methyl ester carboxylesterase